METTKQVFLALAAVFVLALSGCTQTPQQYVCADGKSIVNDISLCPATAAANQTTITQYICADGKTTVTDISKCPVQTATLTLDAELEVCSGMPEMQGSSIEEICISGLAAKHENASLCKKLSYDGKRTCYILVATATNNADVCADAGTEKNYCYQQYATNAQDVSVCEKITDVNYKDNCYYSLASTLGDGTLCDKIKSLGQKDSCYFSIAMNMRDSSYCDKITDSNQKQNCQQNLQGGYNYK